MSENKNLDAMRHTAAHVLATAVMKLWPEAKLGVGPVIENGFYYDVDLGDKTISEDDFETIEAQMNKVIAEDQAMTQSDMSIDEAIAWAAEKKQTYKEELLNDLKRDGTTSMKDLSEDEAGTVGSGDQAAVDSVGFYTNGDFTDLCRGPHVESTGKVGAFKLMRVAGAYWRGNEKNAQMQRVYGIAFDTQEELEAHLEQLELAKERDHRKLGKELELFFMSDEVGSGLPLMMPKGETLKDNLMRYMRQEEKSRGYQFVSTPVLTQEKLFELSGHAKFYAEDMYSTAEDEEGNKFYLKPMNCPHNHMIYNKMVQSYRDLPLRLSEYSGLYRYELSGTLSGLIRVRGPITQNDSHIYVTRDQLKQELVDLMQFFKATYEEFDFDNYWYRLSLPDFSKDKYDGDQEIWQYATDVIIEVLDEVGAEYVSEVGEAAFYGPKIDVQTKNVSGKEDSIATMQLDVLVPKRMGLTYIDNEGKEQHPFVIHKSIMGAFERFMGFLLEKTGGDLPLWLAPEQVRVVPVNDKTEEFLNQVKAELDTVILDKPLRHNELRYNIDARNESLGKRLHEASAMKVPITIIVGPKDAVESLVSVKHGENEDKVALTDLASFISKLAD